MRKFISKRELNVWVKQMRRRGRRGGGDDRIYGGYTENLPATIRYTEATMKTWRRRRWCALFGIFFSWLSFYFIFIFYFVPADLLVSAKIRAFHGYCRKTLVLLGIQSGTKQPCFCTDCTVRNQLQNQNFEYIFFNVQTFEYIEFLPSKKVDRIATFPTIKNKRCLISFPGFFFLLEFMFMVFFFFFS